MKFNAKPCDQKLAPHCKADVNFYQLWKEILKKFSEFIDAKKFYSSTQIVNFSESKDENQFCSHKLFNLARKFSCLSFEDVFATFFCMPYNLAKKT